MPENKDFDIRRLRAGDEDVYLKIYHEYSKRLYSFALQYLKSQELAEDAVQDTFIKLWTNRDTINTNIKGFLFTTIKNHMLNMIRNNKKRTLKKIQLEQQQRQPVNDTEEVILNSEYQEILQRALSELPAGKKQIFEMKTIEGLTNEEISFQLCVTVNTVKSQYYHASKFIKNYLEKYADIRTG